MLAAMDRVYAKMEEFGLNVLVASSPENVVYFTDHQCHRSFCFRLHQATTFAVIPKRELGEPILIIPANDAGIACAYPPAIRDIYTYGRIWTNIESDYPMTEVEKGFRAMLQNEQKHKANAQEALFAALKSYGFKQGTLGMEFSHCPSAILLELQKAFSGVTVENTDALFQMLRMVKSPQEQERLRQAGIKNEKSVQAVLQRLADGVSETELTQIYMSSVAAEGGHFEYWNTAGGTMSSMAMMSGGHFDPRSTKHLCRGDIYRYDGGSIFHHYHADAGGCACIGKPSTEQARVYAALNAGMERIWELLKPGALPSDILREAVKKVEASGVPQFGKYSFFCGHGVGLQARDLPMFVPPAPSDNRFIPAELPLEENTVVSVEVPYGELGLGGFQIEYTMLITRTGCEKLYPHERELVIC